MTIIHPTKPSAMTGPGPAHSRRPSHFRLAETPAEPETQATAGLEPVHLGGLLALQEAGPDTPRNRAARRHGQQMLDLLRGLQLATLGAARADPDSLPRLARLAHAMPTPDDPRLAEILHAIATRAAVELARRDIAIPGQT